MSVPEFYSMASQVWGLTYFREVHQSISKTTLRSTTIVQREGLICDIKLLKWTDFKTIKYYYAYTIIAK